VFIGEWRVGVGEWRGSGVKDVEEVEELKEVKEKTCHRAEVLTL
jgi:hypothetical protein